MLFPRFLFDLCLYNKNAFKWGSFWFHKIALMVHFLFKYSVGKEKSDSVWPSFQERDDVARKVFVKKMTLHLNDTNLTRSLRSRQSLLSKEGRK